VVSNERRACAAAASGAQARPLGAAAGACASRSSPDALLSLAPLPAARPLCLQCSRQVGALRRPLLSLCRPPDCRVGPLSDSGVPIASEGYSILLSPPGFNQAPSRDLDGLSVQQTLS
jgi:hypothetical protein